MKSRAQVPTVKPRVAMAADAAPLAMAPAATASPGGQHEAQQVAEQKIQHLRRVEGSAVEFPENERGQPRKPGDQPAGEQGEPLASIMAPGEAGDCSSSFQAPLAFSAATRRMATKGKSRVTARS
jgi:hypothetical protein